MSKLTALLGFIFLSVRLPGRRPHLLLPALPLPGMLPQVAVLRITGG
jgi:hypothetical protein